MKTPQVTTVLFLNSDQWFTIRNHIVSEGNDLRRRDFAFVADSEATVSSENSESEIIRERERDRDGPKK